MAARTTRSSSDGVLTGALRRRWLTAAALIVGITVQAVVGLRAGASPVHDSGFRLLTPGDGAQVGNAFEVEWSRGTYHGRFAVILGDAVPGPGAAVTASATVVVTSLTAIGLQLLPHQGGPPGEENWHQLTIIPLDASGHRRGEDAIVFRVRGSG